MLEFQNMAFRFVLRELSGVKAKSGATRQVGVLPLPPAYAAGSISLPQCSCPGLAHGLLEHATHPLHAGRRLSKLSQRIVAMATCILRKPPEPTSPSGHAVAMMLAHAAWNHAVEGGPDFNVEFIRRWIRPEAERNPGCLQELKSPDLPALLHEMVAMKGARYPRDRRVILACEFTPQRTLRVNSMVREADVAHHDQGHEQAQG